MIAARKDIAIVHGTCAVILRPSLRAATILERLHDGWPELFRRLDQLDTETVREIIRVAASDRTAAEALIASFCTRPLAVVEKAVSAPLGELLSALLCASDDDAMAGTSTAAEPLPWAKAYAQLFEIGTGWLGWSARDTWEATPAEIEAALKGHVVKLKAVHGAADDDQADSSIPSDTAKGRDVYTPARLRQIEEQGFDPAFDREALRVLKARHHA